MDAHRLYRRSPTTLARSLGREILVLAWDPTHRTDVVSLEGSAAAVWALLAEPLDRPSLISTAVSTYGVGAGAIASQIDAIVDQLEERGLVESVPDHA